VLPGPALPADIDTTEKTFLLDNGNIIVGRSGDITASVGLSRIAAFGCKRFEEKEDKAGVAPLACLVDVEDDAAGEEGRGRGIRCAAAAVAGAAAVLGAIDDEVAIGERLFVAGEVLPLVMNNCCLTHGRYALTLV